MLRSFCPPPIPVQFKGDALDTRFAAKTSEVLLDYKGSMHESVRWSDYHDSYKPAQGMVWDTDHTCTLTLRSADDVDASDLSLEDNAVEVGDELAIEENSPAPITMPGLAP